MDLKIAMIEPVCAHRGMDYYDYSLCRGLIKAGCSVTLYTSVAGPLSHEGFDVLEYFKGVFGKDFVLLRVAKWYLALIKSLNDAKARGVSIVHFHFFDFGPLQRLNVWAAKRKGFKVVATIHDAESFYVKRSDSAKANILERLDGIIVNSKASRDGVVTAVGSQRVKMEMIAQGHHLEYVGKFIDKESAQSALNIKASSRVFLFFGSIRKEKALDIALRAMCIVKKSLPGAKLIVAGKLSKVDESFYKNIITECGIEDVIIWHERFIDQDLVDKYYMSSDVVLVPYRRIYQSAVLIMAMSYGVPVIASDLPAMKEVVSDGENGFLFKTEDYEDLARVMIKAVEDETKLKRIGAAGRRYVEKNNDWKEIADKTLSFYRGI